jgi:hypothetical protein
MKNLLALTIPGGNGSIEVQAPSGIPTGGLNGDGGRIISWGIGIFLFAAIILALGFLVYGGITWITSGGDKTKVESARKTLIYAIVGLAIVFLSFAIIGLVGAFLGTNLLDFSSLAK